MFKYLFSFFLFLNLTYAQNQIDFRTAFLYKADINSHQAYKMQQKGVLLVDTRTKKEFNTLRAKDSINIPIFYEKNNQRVLNKEFVIQISRLLKNDKNKEIILICRSGSRTKFASNILAYYGFSEVFNVKEGFQYDWLKNNLPAQK